MTHGPLSTRDILILAVLSEQSLHGYGLVKAIEVESGGDLVLDPANLYRTLNRMLESGWIGEAPTEGYSRRRTYQITPEGRLVLRGEMERLSGLVKRFAPTTGA